LPPLPLFKPEQADRQLPEIIPVVTNRKLARPPECVGGLEP
jgi:hypothetical protein